MRVVRVLLAALILVGPGTPATVALADSYTRDPKSGKMIRTADAAGQNAPTPKVVGREKVDAAIAAVQHNDKLPEDQKAQAVDVLQRYRSEMGDSESAEAQATLDNLVKDLKDGKKDPGLALAGMFDRMNDFARTVDNRSMAIDVLASGGDPNRSVVAVRNTMLGRTLYLQQTDKIDASQSLRTIRRPDENNPGKETIEAIILENNKGAAQEQRVLYNRKVHQLFGNLKKLYFDQCGLVRRINSGSKFVTNTGCPSEEGTADPKMTDEVRERLRKFYESNKNKFPPDILSYLAELDRLKAAGKLDTLKDWKRLEYVQRLAMAFYNENQLEQYQRVVIMQLTNYFSTVTNVQPKSKKGDDQIDIGAKDLKEFQGVLDQFKKGDMEGYSWFLHKLGYSNIDENDKKYITPELMSLAAEAFADVAYAAKAQGKLLDPKLKLSGEERDALIEETGQWLKLAQIQVQQFDMHTQAIQLTRLAEGKVRGIGIEADDTKMQEEAYRLAAVARAEYLPALQQANREAKESLLKQTVSSFYQTYQNAASAYLYTDTLGERLAVLAAKLDQMRALYLAREFEKVRNRPEYVKAFSAVEKVEAGAYQYFLKNLPREVAAVAAKIDALRDKFKALAGSTEAGAIRTGLAPLGRDYIEIVKLIYDNNGDVPTTRDVQLEAQRLNVKQGRLFAAVQAYSNNLRMFDMLNELEVYVDKYASSRMVFSKSDTFWTKLTSFKWLDAAYNVGGFREKSVDWMLTNPLTNEAFQKLKANHPLREKMKDALRKGDFKAVNELAALLDCEKWNAAMDKCLEPSKAAKKAIEDAKLDKLDEDPADFLDFEGMLGKQYTNDAQTAAMGATIGRFNQLSTLIMGYAGASAIFDTAVTSVLTAVGGPLISFASRGAEALVVAGKMAQVTRAMSAWNELTTIGKAIRILATIVSVPGKMIEFAGKVILNTGRNFRKVLALPKAESAMAAVKQIALKETWYNAVKATVGSTAMMGGISAGMQSVAYAAAPETSQYKSLGDAAMQGGFQGMAFGAKAGLLTHMSPVPATAFSGRMGTWMRGIAETPGPISGAVNVVAKVSPGLSKSAVAESGALGAMAQAGLNASAGWNMAIKMATYGGGIVDGALKYYLAAELPRHLVQVGSMVEQNLTKGFDDGVSAHNAALGQTNFMATLADAQHFSMSFAEVSWLLMPTNPAFSPKEIRDQARASQGYNFLVNQGPEMTREIANAPNGHTIEYVKPWYQRGVWEILTGAPRSETFTVNEQYRQMAARRMMQGKEGGFTDAQVIALANAPGEGMGQVVSLEKLVKGLENMEGFKKELKASVPGVALAPGEAALVVDPRKVLIKDPATKQWRDAKPTEARIVSVEGEPTRIELFDAKTNGWIKAGSEGAPLARLSWAGRPAEVRITIESMAAAKAELDSRLSGRGGADLRSTILTQPETLSGRLGVKLDAKQIEGLQRGAALAEMEMLPATTNPFSWMREMAGRFSDAINDRKMETKQQMVMRRLRDETHDETQRLLDKPELRLEAVRDQTLELARRATDAGDKAVLEKVATTLGEPGKPVDVITKAAAQLDAAADAKKADAVGVPKSTFENLKRSLNGELTADIVMAAARRRVDGRIRPLVDNAGFRAEIARDQALDLAGKAPTPETKALYEQIAQTLTGKTDGASLKKAAGQIETAIKQSADGAVRGDLGTLLKTVQGEVRTDLLMGAARRDGRNKTLSPRAAALDNMRQALETDASRQVVVRDMLDAFQSRDMGKVGKAVDLYVDIWERGAFGQMAGERVVGKDGKLEWSLPAEREFKNRFGYTIPEFRKLQREVIKKSLQNIAEGSNLNFAQMPTGGGKTLTNFTLIEFLDAHAKAHGRDGVMYLTTNPDLVAQAKEDYTAFFGKKPGFEILTYGDLSARIAQAQEQGAQSPLHKFYIVADEGDKPASEVPTSVGMFNGGLTKPRVDPVLKVMNEIARRFVDSPEGFYQTHARPGEGRVNENTFQQRMKDDPQFAKDFKNEVKKSLAEIQSAYDRLRSDEFRKSIDLTEYPEYLALFNGNRELAQKELQKKMIAEFKHARSSAESLHGSYEAQVERLLQGGYQFASEPERSTKLTPDKDANRTVISYNNGIAYDNLSTLEGPFGSVYHGRGMNNEFESAGVLDYYGLIKEAKDAGTIFFATSGTCAAKIRDIFINHFGFRFTGEISVADPMKTRLLTAKEDPNLVKETLDFVRAPGKTGGRNNIAVKYYPTMEAAEAAWTAFAKEYGGDTSRMSMLVRPGSALEEGERYSSDVKMERNLKAFEKGEAEVVFIVGWAGLRGLEMNLKEYKGRQARMDILDPQRLPTEELTQLIGRLAEGRAGMLSLRDFRGIVQQDALLTSELLPRALGEMSALARDAQNGGDMLAAERLIKEQLPKGRTYEPQAIIDAVVQRDLDRQHWGDPKWEKKPNPVWDEVLLPVLKDPEKLQANELINRISEINKLRGGEGLTEAQRQALMEGTPADAAKALNGMLKDVAGKRGVLDVLVAALGRQEQANAIQSSGILKGENKGPAK